MVLGTEIYVKQYLLIIRHEKREKLLIQRNPISEKKHFFQGHFTIEVKYR